ncbi:hypothetical protein BDR22DRAFT_7747 [Usnea florida]
MPPKAGSTKLAPQRLPPLPKLRVRRPNKPPENPCVGIMISVLGCWASAGNAAAGCQQLEQSLRACMDSPVQNEDGEEECDQLPSHEALSEDQGTNQAGQMRRNNKRAHKRKCICNMIGDDLSQWQGNFRGEVALERLLKPYRCTEHRRRCLTHAFLGAQGNRCAI